MRDGTALEVALHSLDGGSWGGYRTLLGAWALPDFELHVEHVQVDPFAPPSRVRVLVGPSVAGFDPDLLETEARRVAIGSLLARTFAQRAREATRRAGSGRSGVLEVEPPGQEILPQTAVRIGADGRVEARLGVGLPARGRRPLGAEAGRLLLDTLPAVVRASLLAEAYPPGWPARWTGACEEAQHLRALLPTIGLVAFVADGAILPRRSGVDDRPLVGPGVVPFRSPDSLRVTLSLPGGGRVTGMGIPAGVTLIVGGGFHGKSTLLQALQAGIHDHVPGDGRERVVTVADAVKVRAEDGRSVAGVDVSSFIDGLPGGASTRAFTTTNASGSTSQAAGIAEALEAGSRTLLMDEDTCATNLMIRDRRIQALVPREAEPITPLVDRVREMHERARVSSLLVLGGSGDYLDAADTVLLLRDHVVHDVTARAHEVARATPTGRTAEARTPFTMPGARRPAVGSLDPARGRRAVATRVPDGRTLLFGDETVDVGAVEQLVARGQLRAIAAGLVLAAERWVDGERTVPEILDALEATLAEGGLDALDPRLPGDLTGFRRFEAAAVLNRIRSLRVS